MLVDIRHQTNTSNDLPNSWICLMKNKKTGKTNHGLFFRNETMKRREVRFRGMNGLSAG